MADGGASVGAGVIDGCASVGAGVADGSGAVGAGAAVAEGGAVGAAVALGATVATPPEETPPHAANSSAMPNEISAIFEADTLCIGDLASQCRYAIKRSVAVIWREAFSF